jgi:hypothetical protein
VLAAVLGSGCAIQRVRTGDDRFLAQAPPDWTPGVTTLRDVAAALGPPDAIRSHGDELVFVYRYQEDLRRSIAIDAYLRLFRGERERQSDRTLLAVFGPDDRLRYWGGDPDAPTDR